MRQLATYTEYPAQDSAAESVFLLHILEDSFPVPVATSKKPVAVSSVRLIAELEVYRIQLVAGMKNEGEALFVVGYVVLDTGEVDFRVPRQHHLVI